MGNFCETSNYEGMYHLTKYKVRRKAQSHQIKSTNSTQKSGHYDLQEKSHMILFGNISAR